MADLCPQNFLEMMGSRDEISLFVEGVLDWIGFAMLRAKGCEVNIMNSVSSLSLSEYVKFIPSDSDNTVHITETVGCINPAGVLKQIETMSDSCNKRPQTYSIVYLSGNTNSPCQWITAGTHSQFQCVYEACSDQLILVFPNSTFFVINIVSDLESNR